VLCTSVLLPLQVTAYASGNPDFAGSCGRCYEVKCLLHILFSQRLHCCLLHLQVTAYASGNPDFAGSCGRCYEMQSLLDILFSALLVCRPCR
jgi:hypothetical protein